MRLINDYNFLSQPKLIGSHPRLALEELGEERRIREVQRFSDLPDRQVAVFQL